MSRAQEYVSTLERDGFVVVPSFLDENLVNQAKLDLEEIYARDLEERKSRNADEPLFTHGSTMTVLTPPSHLALRLPGKSAALDQCYEKILTDPMSSELLTKTVGNFKMRDVNCRYMTGSVDTGNFLNGPHELHRDSPGEFTIAIFLNEVSPGDNAGTEVVPGSHKYPWCPRWNALFGVPFYLNRKGVRGPENVPRYNIFSRLLHRFFVKGHNAHGVYGKPGDFYIFLNDTWHGRVPNMHGQRGMIVMAGGFPTDYPFPDEPQPFDPVQLNKIPPTYRRIAARDLPPNTDKTSIVHRLQEVRRRERPTNLFWWARRERELMVKWVEWSAKAGVKLKAVREAFASVWSGVAQATQRVVASIKRVFVVTFSVVAAVVRAPLSALKRAPGYAIRVVKGVIRRTLGLAKPIYGWLIKLPVLGTLLQGAWQRVRGLVRA